MSTSSHDDDGDHRGAKTISDMRSRQLQWLQGGRAGSIVVVCAAPRHAAAVQCGGARKVAGYTDLASITGSSTFVVFEL